MGGRERAGGPERGNSETRWRSVTMGAEGETELRDTALK
jgi:hypothetical protein